MADLQAQIELFEKIKSYPPYDEKNPAPETASEHLDKFAKHVIGEKPDLDTLDNLKALHESILSNAPKDSEEFARQAALVEWLYSRAAHQAFEAQRLSEGFIRRNIRYSAATKTFHKKYTEILERMRTESKAKFSELSDDKKYRYDKGQAVEAKPEPPSFLTWFKNRRDGLAKYINDIIEKNKTIEARMGFAFTRGIRSLFWQATGVTLKWLFKRFVDTDVLSNKAAATMKNIEAAQISKLTPFLGPDGKPAQSKDFNKLKEMERKKRQYENFSALSHTQKNDRRIKKIEAADKVAETIAKKWNQHDYIHKTHPDLINPEDFKKLVKHFPDEYENPSFSSLEGKQKAEQYAKDMEKYYQAWEANKLDTKIPDINAYLPSTLKVKRLDQEKSQPPPNTK